ncbi:MAG: hypothetical protein ABIO06_10165 [Pseudolysinimonas sp.]
MLSHGRHEIEALAAALVSSSDPPTSGWDVETWKVGPALRALAIACYKAVLLGDMDDAAINILSTWGVKVADLLIAPYSKNDKLTRADVVELLAAAMFLRDGFTLDDLFLPNVPKMSRKKSESGLDVIGVLFGNDLEGLEDLLHLASVKHSINKKSAADVRWKVVDSLSRKTLGQPYMTTQLRVLNARLKEQGVDAGVARRVYYFLRDDSNVRVVGVAAVDTDLSSNLDSQVDVIPKTEWPQAVFRKVSFDHLRDLADDCP